MLAAAVLTVIGIGVGLVKGLPPATTYSLGTARFAIVFPTTLQPHHVASTGSPTCALLEDVGEADHDRLAVSILVSEGNCVNGIGSASGFDCFRSPVANGVTLRPVADAYYCYAGIGVERSRYFVGVAVGSSEGLGVAQRVADSFVLFVPS